jgi:hypothetical protein
MAGTDSRPGRLLAGVTESSAMTEWDDEPELAGYEPHEDRPLRSRRTVVILRVAVVVGILCLVLPQLATSISVASATAQDACAAWVKYEAPNATGSSARFELFGVGGVGWQCYTVGAYGGDRNVAFLGLIPISPTLSRVPSSTS